MDDNEVAAEYQKAVTRELNARASMFSAAANVLNIWAEIATSLKPAITEIATEAVAEIKRRA